MLFRSGPEQAAAACREAVRAHRVELVVSSGLAGALASARVGDLLVGSDVRSETDERMRWSCAGTLADAALRTAERAGMPAHRGSFVTVPRMVWQASDKQALAERTGAIGVDMESAALAGVAAEQGIPFVVFRHVSDLRDENMPVNFNLFMRPADWMKGVAACVANPSCVMGLLRLRAQMKTATDAMSRFFAQWLDELASPVGNGRS